MRFTAIIEALKGKTFVVLPVDPNAIWRRKQVHHVHGTVGGVTYRGAIEEGRIKLGPAWLRDSGIAAGDQVEVVLEPEGFLTDNVAPDIAAALNADDAIRDFFDSLPGFYRNNFMRDINAAKRPETRQRNIDRMMAALERRQRAI